MILAGHRPGARPGLASPVGTCRCLPGWLGDIGHLGWQCTSSAGKWPRRQIIESVLSSLERRDGFQEERLIASRIVGSQELDVLLAVLIHRVEEGLDWHLELVVAVGHNMELNPYLAYLPQKCTCRC